MRSPVQSWVPLQKRDGHRPPLFLPYIELTSAYFDIINTINSEKALDVELHAVLQLVSRSRKSISYVADIYSNKMPVDCAMQSRQFSLISAVQKQKITSDERLNVAEDCADVLSAFLSITEISLEQGQIKAGVGVDVVYRDSNGLLSSVHRTLTMEGDGGGQNLRLCSARLQDVYLRPDGQFIDGHIVLEISSLLCTSIEVRKVGAVSLNEEAAYDLSGYPTVTLVRVERENLWELAKTYHSSVEQIRAMNDLEEEISGRLLLIPKAL